MFALFNICSKNCWIPVACVCPLFSLAPLATAASSILSFHVSYDAHINSILRLFNQALLFLEWSDLTVDFVLSVQLDVWTKEREVAGLQASLSTLTSEVQRLNKLCAEWKEAEDSLRKKWKKIEEFDTRRSELESIHTALLRANMVSYLSTPVSRISNRSTANSYLSVILI